MNTLKQELNLMFIDHSRLNIIRYLSYQIFSLFVFMLVTGIYLFFSFDLDASLFERTSFLVLNGILVALFFLLNIFWFIRRLHDIGLSGYWILLPSMTIVVAILYAWFHGPWYSEIFILSLSFASLLVFVLTFMPGTVEVNRYGKVPPKNNFFNYAFFVAFLLIFIVNSCVQVTYSLNEKSRTAQLQK